MKEPLLMLIGKKQSDHSFWVTGIKIKKGHAPCLATDHSDEGPLVLPRVRVCSDGCSFPHSMVCKEVLRESSLYELY